MKLKKNILIVAIIITVLVFFGKGFYDNFSLICGYYCSSFNGEVKDISYSEQKHIKVLVGDDWVPLSLYIKYEIKVEVGDTIVKEANNYSTKLIKNGREFDISSDRNSAKYKKYCKCD